MVDLDIAAQGVCPLGVLVEVLVAVVVRPVLMVAVKVPLEEGEVGEPVGVGGNIGELDLLPDIGVVLIDDAVGGGCVACAGVFGYGDDYFGGIEGIGEVQAVPDLEVDGVLPGGVVNPRWCCIAETLIKAAVAIKVPLVKAYRSILGVVGVAAIEVDFFADLDLGLVRFCNGNRRLVGYPLADGDLDYLVCSEVEIVGSRGVGGILLGPASPSREGAFADDGVFA